MHQARVQLERRHRVDGTLDPTFAVPLVHGTWSFGEVLDAIEIPATLETDASGEITAIFPFDAFQSSPIQLVPLSESADADLVLNDEQAMALSLLAAGEEIDVDFSNAFEVPMPELAEVDSVWFGGGTLTISMESALPLNLTAVGVCENLVIEGQPLTVELGLLAGSSTTDLLDSHVGRYPSWARVRRSDLGLGVECCLGLHRSIGRSGEKRCRFRPHSRRWM